MKTRFGLIFKTGSLALAGGAILLHAAPAGANGRFPQSNQIVFSPTDPDLIVLRTTYGILPSRDHGQTWGFLCEDALGVGPNTLADPSIGLTENNSLLAGVALGLDVSPDTGCNWNCIGGPLARQSIVDLAVRPDKPSSAVAITGTYVTVADSGQEQTYSQIFETNDDGMTWAPLGPPIDPTVIVETVDVAKTDPNRLYVSGVRGYGSARTAMLLESKDKGATWTEWDVPPAWFDPTIEDSIFIGAVDPTNADRVYLRSSAQPMGGQSRLTVVNFADGGPPFMGARAFNVGMAFLGLTGEMLGLAVSEDGSKIYIGSVEDGLWSADTSDLVFQKVSSIIVQCLATHGSELWACSAAKTGFVAGVSTDGGKTFTTKLPLVGTLTGPIACAPNPTGGTACGQMINSSQCGTPYQTFCNLNSCQEPTFPIGSDAESPTDASPSNDASRSGSGTSSCDLAAPGQGGAAGVEAVFALVGLALRRRRGP